MRALSNRVNQFVLDLTNQPLFAYPFSFVALLSFSSLTENFFNGSHVSRSIPAKTFKIDVFNPFPELVEKVIL
jgi:hypothetical protein